MRDRFVRGFLALLLFTLCVTIGAQTPSAPAQKPDDQPPVRFRTEANFVRVDVYPTANGRPVQDLRREDFEILEDGVLQPVEMFEFVQVRPAGPQTARVEASSRDAAEQMAANPRHRVFIVFLDVPHVTIEAAHRINQPLIRLLDQIVGPDDLIGVMTTAMAASQLTFGRKTEVLARGLRDNWPWGQRHRVADMDERETMYHGCYAMYDNGPPLVRKMRDRRRERMTLEALEDLVRYLHSVREERKAIITISEGWALYRPDPEMMELRYIKTPARIIYEEMPGSEHIGVGPGGKLTTTPGNTAPHAGTKYQCDTDRRQLSDADNDQFFRELLDTANRANASFYPVDPRGLAAFDNPIGPDTPPPPVVDHAQLRGRLISLQTLAENTDGLAVINTNNLDQGMRRIADDLTSYYLLGYYSGNPKLDGRFRQIRVRVKRPGIDVRARRGYRAATEAEVTAARKAADAPVSKDAAALTAALGALSRIRPDAKLMVNASAVSGESLVWVAGELPSQPGENPWARGATADVNVSAGGPSETARVTLAPGERAFLTAVPIRVPELADVDVRVRVSTADGSSSPATGTIRLEVAPGAVQPLMFRRGGSTANRWRPAADYRFSRTERIRLELPVAAGVPPGGARLLDKTGSPRELPVMVGERTDNATRQRWITAEIALAPLAPGDYAIEIGLANPGGEQKTITAIRVTR